MTVVADHPDGTAATSKPSFRGDVDGLRAVAIVLVVAFHAGIPGFGGGFVGVDVFFAISGWLITRNLLAVTTADGRPGLIGFWSRRIRRLVPAMALMIVVVFAATVVAFSPLDWSTVIGQGRAAALYVSNIVFARADSNYFAASVQDSPFLHTWSLAVEEQFYLVWPVLFALAALVTRRVPRILPKVLIGVFALTFVVSLAVCVVLTNQASPWAFFSLPTRAWEFAAAGLVAALPIRRAVNDSIRGVAAVGGLALIIGATLLLDDATPYPGLWALLPVGGALLVVVAGEGVEGADSSAPSQVLALAPMQWVGRVSYSWYLWHWPAMVLAVAYFESSSVSLRTAAGIVSLGLAAFLYRFYESPIRFSTVLRRSNLLTIAVGAAITVFVLACSIGLGRLASHELQQSPYRELKAVRSAHPTYRCPVKEVTASGIEFCAFGDPQASQTVVLVGDSHARHWFEAFGAAAEQLGVRLVAREHSSCPAIPVTPDRTGRDNARPGDDVACDEFRSDTATLIDEVHADAVVVSEHLGYEGPRFNDAGTDIDPDDAGANWNAALSQYLDDLDARGVRAGLVLDNARLPEDAISCLAKHDTCTYDRDEVFGLSGDLWQAERDVLATRPGVATFDASAGVCGPEVCVTELGGIYVYADDDHLSLDYTETQVDRVAAFLQQLLEPS